MDLLLVALFGLIIVMTMVMFLLLKRIVTKINQQAKNYFLEELQAYDTLLEEKEEKLKGLKEQTTDLKEEEQTPSSSEEVVYLYINKTIDYQDEELFKKMKQIDKKFNVNQRKLIIKFLEQHFNKETINEYQRLIEIRNRFSEEQVYTMMMKRSAEQVTETKKILKEEIALLNDFKPKKGKFTIVSFLSYLDKIISTLDPYVYIYVGDLKEDYTELSPYIKMKLDENIYKGIMIIYHNTLYDYSLK